MITTNRGAFRTKGTAAGGYTQGAFISMLSKPGMQVFRNGNWSSQRNKSYKDLPVTIRWKNTESGEEGVVAITMNKDRKLTKDIIRELREQ